MVAVWVQHQREVPAPTTPKKNVKSIANSATEKKTGKTGARDAVEQSSCRAASARQLSWFLLRETTSLSSAEQAILTQIHEATPQLAIAQPLVQKFWNMCRERREAAFVPWREAALNSGLPDLRNFVAGLDKDKEAVLAALRLPWSNGPVEGSVNRLKMLKRQMYGRASFDVLRARVLYQPAPA
jgi:transposase